MDAEMLKLVIEVVTLIGTGLGLAMRVGSLKTSIEASLKALSDRVHELRQEAQDERKETRASLAALSTGQQALAIAQGGDHLLLGQLQGTLTALQTRTDEALAAHRKDIEVLRSTQSEQRREVDRLLGRADRG